MALIKACFNNPRPSEVEGTDNPDLELDWSPTEGQSFISGHSLSAILGGIFWFEIGTTWGIIGLTLGLLTGLTRIIAKAHWLRDVIGAGVLSTILYLIAHYYFLV